MTEFNHFFETLQQNVIKDEFVKLTLSKPVRKSLGLQNVYMRLFVVDNKEIFQFKYRYATENQYKQFSFSSATAPTHIDPGAIWLSENKFSLPSMF